MKTWYASTNRNHFGNFYPGKSTGPFPSKREAIIRTRKEFGDDQTFYVGRLVGNKSDEGKIVDVSEHYFGDWKD